MAEREPVELYEGNGRLKPGLALLWSHYSRKFDIYNPRLTGPVIIPADHTRVV